MFDPLKFKDSRLLLHTLNDLKWRGNQTFELLSKFSLLDFGQLELAIGK